MPTRIAVACEAVEPRRLLSADYFGTGGADTIRVRGRAATGRLVTAGHRFSSHG